MDKSFKRWTIWAVVAGIVFICALWWAGNDNGIENVCNALGAQALPYCSANHTAHLWWLVVTVTSGVYLGFYIARVRRLLLRSAGPTVPPPPVSPPTVPGQAGSAAGYEPEEHRARRG